MNQVTNLAFHVIVGNDTHPLLVAAARALLGASLVGGISFLGVWQSTDEMKVLITSGVLPALTYLAARLGIEGSLDTWKQNKK